MKNYVSACVCMLSVFALFGQNQAKYKKIGAAEAQKMMDSGGVTVVDVRTPEEYAEGRIPGAVLLPDYEVKSGAAKVLPDKKAVLLVYCRTGRRSSGAAKALADLGYDNVYDFGGILDWKGAVVK